MKRHPMISLIGILGLVACSEAPTDPVAQAGLRPSLALYDNVRVAFSGVATGCPGSEDVLVSGTEHDLFTAAIDQNGAAHLNGHVTFNFTGTGMVSGREYVGREQFTLDQTASSAGLRTITQIFHAALIAKGEGPTIRIQGVFHLTVTPNGDVTASVDSIRQEC